MVGVVIDVFNRKRNVFLAEIEFWALANKDKDIKYKSKILYEKILFLFDNQYPLYQIYFLIRRVLNQQK